MKVKACMFRNIEGNEVGVDHVWSFIFAIDVTDEKILNTLKKRT